MKATKNTPKRSGQANTGKTSADQKGKANTTALEYIPSNKWFIPLIIALAVVPLIVMAHLYDHGLGKYTWFSGDAYAIDFFMYYKGVVLQLVAGVMIFVMCYLATKSKPSFITDKKSLSPMIAAGLFAVMTLVSSILSKHPKDAFFGGYEQFEGCLTVLSYVVCFMMAFGFARSEDIIKYVLNALVIGALIVGLIGALQTFGLNIFATPPVKGIISLFEFMNRDFDVNNSMDVVFSTLYNPNYVGSYVPLVLPFTLYLTICGENLSKKILAGVTSVSLIISLYGAMSLAGLIGTAVAVGVAFILFLPRVRKAIRIGAIAAASVAVVGALVIVISGGYIDRFLGEKESRVIENIKTDGYGLTITTETGKKIRAQLDEELLKTMGWSQDYPIEEKFTVTDKDTDEKIATKIEDIEEKNEQTGEVTGTKKHVTIDQEGYPAISFYIDMGQVAPELDPQGFGFLYDRFHVVEPSQGTDWSFSGEDDGSLRLCADAVGKLAKLKDVERAGFEGRYTFASGRGYIWACTIPTLKKYIFAGAGPDNFVYATPNDDFIGKDNWGYHGLINTKPHNMFLQIWVQDGLIALLAFLALYLIFIIRALKLSFGKNKAKAAGKAFSAWGVVAMTAIGTSAYMVAGVANDSIVCVAPVYWILLGIGYAAEHICRTQKDVSMPTTEEENTEAELA